MDQQFVVYRLSFIVCRCAFAFFADFACPSGQLPCIHKYCFTQRAQRSKARKEKYVTTQFRRERCEKSLIKRLNKDMYTG